MRRLKLRQAIRAVPGLIRDPYDLPRVIALFDSVAATRPMQAAYAQMLAGVDADERDHLRELTAQPVDREWLRTLSPHTFGRSYADWMDARGFSETFYREVFPPSTKNVEENWVIHRWVKTHDMHHALLGIDHSVAQEMALQMIHCLNFREPTGALSVLGMPWLLAVYPERRYTARCIATAARASLRMPNLFRIPYEEHWQTPLAALRSAHRIPTAGLMPPRTRSKPVYLGA